MAWMGPNATNALSAGFQGQDLAEQMRQRALQTQAQQMAMRDAQQKRDAQALMGQVLQQMMQGGGQGSAIPLPAQGGAAASPGPPGTAPMPQGGAPAAAVLAPLQGQPQDLTEQMRQRAGRPAPGPKSAGGVVDAAPEPSGPAMTWPAIMDTIKKVAPNAPPQLVAEVANGMAPMVLANQKEQYDRWKAQQDLDLKDASRLDRLFTMQQQLDFRYATTQSAEEKSAIQRQRMALQEQIAQITSSDRRYSTDANNTSRETVAGMNIAGRDALADKNNAARQAVTEYNATSKERMAANALDLKKELGEGKLDLDADQIAKTFMVRNRALDLQEQGMEKKDALERAKLEATMTIAQMRDKTTQRGQDIISADKKAAIEGKLDVLRGKAATGADRAINSMDGLITDAKDILDDPNLDKSVGNWNAHLPGVFSQDMQNFRDKLDSFRSEKLLALVEQMKATGANGSTGFGRITNFEAQQIQNSIASLKDTQDPTQFRAAITKLINTVSMSKAHVRDAYAQQYGGVKPAASTGVPVAKSDAPSIDTPPSVAQEPDGTVFKMGGKTYTKQGAKAVETAGP